MPPFKISTTAPTASNFNSVSGIMIIIDVVFTNVKRAVFDFLDLLYYTLKLKAPTLLHQMDGLVVEPSWAKAFLRPSVPTQSDPRSRIFQVSERSLADCVVDGAKSVPCQRPWNANALLHIGGLIAAGSPTFTSLYAAKSGRKAYLDVFLTDPSHGAAGNLF